MNLLQTKQLKFHKLDIVYIQKYTILHTGPTDEKGMVQEKGFINGGMMKRQKPVEHIVITINVENIDNTLKKIQSEGGKIVKEPMKVRDMGMAAYFEDSEGNVVGLWQSLRKD